MRTKNICKRYKNKQAISINSFKFYLSPLFTNIIFISALSTEDKLEYQFFPAGGSQVQFRIRAPNDAHIALTTSPSEGDPMWEVRIKMLLDVDV